MAVGLVGDSLAGGQQAAGQQVAEQCMSEWTLAGKVAGKCSGMPDGMRLASSWQAAGKRG